MSFRIKADKQDIREYSLEKGPVSISFNLAFELQEARLEAGIGLAEYEQMVGTPQWLPDDQTMSKCHLLIWYRNHIRIKAVIDSAQIRKSGKAQPKETNFQWPKTSH